MTTAQRIVLYALISIFIGGLAAKCGWQGNIW
jgi:hypothetical protein